jgi:galactose mutarotase-like enzyme
MATLERMPQGPLEAVVLVAGELRATFVPRAGMVGCSLTHRGEELLVQRGGLDAWRGRGKSFALPLLHPWANRLPDWRYVAAGRAVTLDESLGVVHPDEHGLPIHGALGAAEDWDVTDAGADDRTAWLRGSLDYGRRDDRLAAFPFRHTLELDIRLQAGTLTIATTLEAQDEEVPVAFGWHPWLRLPNLDRGDWVLEQPERTAIGLDDRRLPTGAEDPAPAEREPLQDRVLDDHSRVAEDARFALVGGGRTVAVEWLGGYRYAQVFAPQNIDTVCLEPMMARTASLATGEDVRCAAPGERVTGTFRIVVEDA